MKDLEKFDVAINPYKRALLAVLAVRNERRNLYKDSFLNSTMDESYFAIIEKFNRLKFLYENARNSGDDDYEKLEDTIIDAINYSLFMLEKILRGKKKMPDLGGNLNKR